MKQPDPTKDPQPEKPEEDRGILQPLVDDMTPKPQLGKTPTSPPRPPQPAEQDQDAGGGYNPDHTIPQP